MFQDKNTAQVYYKASLIYPCLSVFQSKNISHNRYWPSYHHQFIHVYLCFKDEHFSQFILILTIIPSLIDLCLSVFQGKTLLTIDTDHCTITNLSVFWGKNTAQVNYKESHHHQFIHVYLCLKVKTFLTIDTDHRTITNLYVLR